MIVITFSFLGIKTKVTTEGDKGITDKYDNEAIMKDILAMHNSLLDTDGGKVKEAYKWCEARCAGKFKRGRHMNFFF